MSTIGSDARGRGFSRRQALVASGSLLLACAGLGTAASAAVGDRSHVGVRRDIRRRLHRHGQRGASRRGKVANSSGTAFKTVGTIVDIFV